MPLRGSCQTDRASSDMVAISCSGGCMSNGPLASGPRARTLVGGD